MVSIQVQNMVTVRVQDVYVELVKSLNVMDEKLQFLLFLFTRKYWHIKALLPESFQLSYVQNNLFRPAS